MLHAVRHTADQLILIDPCHPESAVPQASSKKVKPRDQAPEPQDSPPDDPRPVPPVRPTLDDCCQSGCNPCVFDLYDDALTRYETALAEWQARNPQADAAPHGGRR
jgi:hypothetical protein